MDDVRVRVGTATLLSLISFMSVTGAVLAFIWWLIFTPNIRLVFRNRLLLPSVSVIGFFSIILELTGGEGAGYFIRMLVIILIGAWLLHEQKQNDFLNLGSWLLGNRLGFDLGMVAEIAIQTLTDLTHDFQRIRVAGNLKGCAWGPGSIVPSGLILVKRTLSRAQDTTDLLAVRGYTGGGTREPVFSLSSRDAIAGFLALCVAIITLLPVSELFILS